MTLTTDNLAAYAPCRKSLHLVCLHMLAVTGAKLLYPYIMYDPARDLFTSSSPSLDKMPEPERPEALSEEQTQIPHSKPNLNLNLNLKYKKRIRSPNSNANVPSKKRARSPDSEAVVPSKKRGRSPVSESTTLSKKRERSPEPAPKSPPRQRKRPGGASRISTAQKDALRQRQLEREQEQLQQAQRTAAVRGVHDVVRQHYNAVPQRGREWRKTDSRIKGLRNFNNWVKSTLIQKFSPSDDFKAAPSSDDYNRNPSNSQLLVLDIGCGKGGDLGKWQKAPQKVELYVGVDPAEVSVNQARDRYTEMRQKPFIGEFIAKDGFGEWLGTVPIIAEVGIDGSVGPGGGGSSRWGGGGFDVVTMMFCMHYAFESEAKARGMLRNVAGSLKKGGRFIGVIPNSDILRSKVEEFHKRKRQPTTNGHSTPDKDNNKSNRTNPDSEQPGAKVPTKMNSPASETKNQSSLETGEIVDSEVPEWGNSIYRVRFPGNTPSDGIFRPPFGWKYSYFLEEAVEEVPEYVVPWEAFRA